MIRIILAVFIVFLSPALVSAGNGTAELKQQKLQLEIQKLENEIKANRAEENRKEISLWVTIAGSTLGFVTVIWTVFHGLGVIRNKTEETRQNRISALLEQTSSSIVHQRLGGVRGLSQYSSHAIYELLSMASVETSVLVKNNLEDTLALVDKDRRGEVIAANTRSVVRRIHATGRLKGLGYDFPEKSDESEFDLPQYKDLKKQFNDTYEHGMDTGRLYQQRVEGNEDRLNEQFIQQKEVIFNEKRLANLSRAVITRWIRDGEIRSLCVEALDLVESNLYRAVLPRVKSSSLMLPLSLMRHAKMQNAVIRNSVFDNADMFDADISNSRFNNTSFVDTNLRQAIARGTVFNNCDFGNAVLSQGDYTRASFENSVCKKARFKNSILKGANLSHAQLNEAELHKANLSGAMLLKTQFYGAVLIEADFEKAQAQHSKFNGANLKGANFKGANLEGANFSGADISGADFTNAITKDVNMNKVQGLESAVGFVSQEAEK